MGSGVDLAFHLQRIEGVYKGLLSGQFPVRIQPQWIDDHGYAVSVFYGDILFYFPALLRMIGFTLQDAFKIYMLVILTGTTFISFISFKKIFNDETAALAGTVLYVCSNEHIYSRYYSWVGSFSAMMFYPIILAGLYILFERDIRDKHYKRTWLYLLIGFSGILQTHMISCLLVSLFTAILCIICIKKFFRKETLIEIGKAVGAWVLLNLWFLVPFLQYMTGDYGITATLATDEQIIDRYALLANFTDAGKTWRDIFSNNSGIGYAMILVLLCYVLSIPFIKRSKNKIGKESLICFGLVVMGIYFCTDYFPVIAVARFDIVQKFCKAIQYQSRIMGIVVILLACLGGFLITELKENRKAVLYLTIAFCICAFYQDILYFQSLQLEETYLEQLDLISWPADDPYSYAIGNGEYLPVNVNLSDLSREVTYDSEMLQVDNIRRDYLYYELQINNLSNTEQQMIFPLLFYDGYQCKNVKTGEQLQICAGENGMVSVIIPANYDGLLKLDFVGFWYWRLAEIISLLVMMFIIWIIYHYRNCDVLKSVDLEKS